MSQFRLVRPQDPMEFTGWHQSLGEARDEANKLKVTHVFADCADCGGLRLFVGFLKYPDMPCIKRVYILWKLAVSLVSA